MVSLLPERPAPAGVSGWRWWYWAAVPLAAILAYSLALRVGFIADDFIFLYSAHQPEVGLRVLVPGTCCFFYRPVGVAFTWQLGWLLWGYNPLPYHVIQLLLHGAVSLVLGLWLAYATGRKGLGWLGGIIFAVFPFHAEAVSWIAAQWDLLSVLFGLGSLFAFTAWWRTGHSRWTLFAWSVFLYTLAIFTKESLFTFVPILGLAAWLVASPASRREWTRLGLSLLAFLVPISVNVGVRILVTGSLGDYSEARYDYGEFAWDYLGSYAHRLLAPINPSVLGNSAVQVVGLLSSFALVLGLVWFGRPNRRLLLLCATWLILTLLPVLNLPGAVAENLRDSRLLYLPSIGYCIALATLLYATVAAAGRLRPLALGAVAVLILLSGGAAWVQTTPWYMAGKQADEVISEFFKLIPVQPRPNGLVWYVEGIPQRYEGAYILHWGLGLSRILADQNATHPDVVAVPDATQASLAGDKRDAYSVRLKFNDSDQLWHADYAAGVTAASRPPTQQTAGTNLTIWDFTGCSAQAVNNWQVLQAKASCQPGRGLILQPTGSDPQMVAQKVPVERLDPGARFVRLRVAASYPASKSQPQAPPPVSEWFWRTPESGFTQEHRESLQLKADGTTHVYWTFIPVSRIGDVLSGLRFDPVNTTAPAQIEWIAFDLVD